MLASLALEVALAAWGAQVRVRPATDPSYEASLLGSQMQGGGGPVRDGLQAAANPLQPNVPQVSPMLKKEQSTTPWAQ